jgi:hypothetical protein
VLDSKFKFLYCNSAWDRFYLENGGSGGHLASQVVGSSIFEVVPAVLEEFYKSLFESAISSSQSKEFYFQCSSPSEYRLHRMTLLPSVGGLIVAYDQRESYKIDQEGIFIKNKVDRRELERQFRSDDGSVVMCSHCRKARTSDPSKAWHFVADFLERPPEAVSHALCDLCWEYHRLNRQQDSC